MEAVQNAEEVQPDLILLDVGLPTLNVIEAARRIRDADEALSTRARGYFVKSDAGSELLPAVFASLRE